ncbi:MAG TPA: hypothetical protein VFP93_00175, partial [Gammaproteobacteria bacterium]|nr:hypothetical protein [Gammaproteobacteria bacterium]
MRYSNFQLNQIHAVIINEQKEQWQNALQEIITPTVVSRFDDNTNRSTPPNNIPPPPPTIKNKNITVQCPEEIIQLQDILARIHNSNVTQNIVNSLEDELKTRSVEFCLAHKNMQGIRDTATKQFWLNGAIALAFNTKIKNCVRGSEQDNETKNYRKEAETVIENVFINLSNDKTIDQLTNFFLACFRQRNSENGFESIYELAQKTWKKISTNKVEAEITNDLEMQDQLVKINTQKEKFLEMHENLKEAILGKQLKAENYKEDPRYKALQIIIKERDALANSYKVLINLEKDLEKKIQRLE